MNEEGWGFKDVFWYLAIICIALLLAMMLYNRTFSDLFGSSTKHSEETYKDIEINLEKDAHTYTDNYYYKILEPGDEGYVTVRDMQEKHLLKSIKDVKDATVSCSGYVHFKKNETTIYKAYLKCGDNYTTSGYEAKHDEKVLNNR